MTQNCNSCHVSCLSCSGSGSMDCTSCPVGALITPIPATVYTDWGQISNVYTSKGGCSLPCSNGKFYDIANSNCVSCASGCLSCSSLENCFSCDPSTELVQISIPISKKICLAWCNSNEYRSFDGSCLPCFAGCYSCIGAGYQACTSGNCKPGYTKAVLDPQNQSLVSCSETCLSTQFSNTIGGCSNCNPSCLTCQGSTSNDCLSCRTHWILEKNLGSQFGSCRCPTENGFYVDNLNCVPCNIACSVCTGPNSNQC